MAICHKGGECRTRLRPSEVILLGKNICVTALFNSSDTFGLSHYKSLASAVSVRNIMTDIFQQTLTHTYSTSVALCPSWARLVSLKMRFLLSAVTMEKLLACGTNVQWCCYRNTPVVFYWLYAHMHNFNVNAWPLEFTYTQTIWFCFSVTCHMI